MSNNAREDYVVLKSSLTYPPSPPLSRHSNDSDDSLRALEMSDGIATSSGRPGRYAYSSALYGVFSYFIVGGHTLCQVLTSNMIWCVMALWDALFSFAELGCFKLPLSASVTDPGNLHAEGTEKNIGLINGAQIYSLSS